MDLTKFSEYGLLGLMIAAIIFLLFKIIMWTLATTKEILRQAATEREAWITAFNEHTLQARAFHDEVKEAHKFQREEHKESLNNQKELAIILGRINGYKHE